MRNANNSSRQIKSGTMAYGDFLNKLRSEGVSEEDISEVIADNAYMISEDDPYDDYDQRDFRRRLKYVRNSRQIKSSQKGFENVVEGTQYDDYHIDTRGMGILDVENIIGGIESRGNQAVLTVQCSDGSVQHTYFPLKDWKEYKDTKNNSGVQVTDVWITEVEPTYIRNSRRPIKSGINDECIGESADGTYAIYKNDADEVFMFSENGRVTKEVDYNDDEVDGVLENWIEIYDVKIEPQYKNFVYSSRRPVESSLFYIAYYGDSGDGYVGYDNEPTNDFDQAMTFNSREEAENKRYELQREWNSNLQVEEFNDAIESSRQIKSEYHEKDSIADIYTTLTGYNVEKADIGWYIPELDKHFYSIVDMKNWMKENKKSVQSSSRQIKSSFPRTTKELADWINKNSRHKVQYREPFDDFVFKENSTSFRVDGDEVVMEGHGYLDSEPLTVYINQFKADPSYIRSARYIATDPESGEVLGSADTYEEAVNEWGEDVTITDSEATENQEDGGLFQSRKSIKSDLNVNDEAAYWDGVEDGVNGLSPADEDDPDYMKGWKSGKARLKSMNIQDYNVNSSRRPIKSSLQTEVVENFPEYMVNYAVYGERLDVTDEDVSLYEEWRERNGYGTCFGTGSVYDESYFSNHPAFGLPCTVIPVVFEVSNSVTSSKKPETTKQFMTRILSELETGEITEDEAAKEIAEANDVNIGYAKQILSNYIADKDRYITSGMLELGEALNVEFNPDGNLDSWSVDFVSDPEKSAPTLGGELVRAARYIIAAFRDSGEKIGWGYAKEMLNPAARFIIENTDFTGNDAINDMLEGNVPDDESYREWIDEFEVEFADYLRDHEDYFHKLNKKDFTEGKNEGDSFSPVKELLISDDEGNDYFFEYIDGQFVCTGVDEGTTPEYTEGDVITAEDYMFDDINFDEEFGKFEQDGFIYSWEDGDGESVTISDVSLKNPMFWYDDILTEEEIANLIENGVKIYDPSKGTSDTNRRELKISDIM